MDPPVVGRFSLYGVSDSARMEIGPTKGRKADNIEDASRLRQG